MSKLIPDILNWNWNFPLLYKDNGNKWYVKFQYCCKLINMLCDYYKSDKILLLATNSENWITIYLAALSQGKDLTIIPTNMDWDDLIHTTVIKKIGIMFCDKTIIFSEGWSTRINTLVDNSNVIIDTDSLKILFNRVNEYNENISSSLLIDPDKLTKVLLDNNTSLMVEKIAYENMGDSLSYKTTGSITYPDIVNETLVWHKIRYNDIKTFLMSARNVLPLRDRNVVVRTNYATSHFVTVLLPFSCNAHITDDDSNPHILMVDSKYINGIWEKCLLSLFSGPVRGFLLSRRMFTWLFKIVARKALKMRLGTNVESLVIYNAEVSQTLLDLLRGIYKVYTTYGKQKCPIIAVNDSRKSLRDKMNRGYLLRGLDVIENEETVRIVDYNNVVIETGDYGYRLPDSSLKIYGQHRHAFKHNNESTLLMLEDKLEEIFIIKKAVITMRRGNLIVLVKVFEELCDAQNITYKQLAQILNMYKNRINKDLAGTMRISSIIIVPKDLWEEHFNGQLKYRYYCL